MVRVRIVAMSVPDRLVAMQVRVAGTRCNGELVLVLVMLVMATIGLMSWLSEPADGRLAALLGHSWFSCPPSVLALSLPALAAALWAIRGLAPMRPRAAGFAAGLLAGSVGAFGYALSCPEASAAFVAVWYSLGIVLAGAVGAALGPHVLRW